MKEKLTIRNFLYASIVALALCACETQPSEFSLEDYSDWDEGIVKDIKKTVAWHYRFEAACYEDGEYLENCDTSTVSVEFDRFECRSPVAGKQISQLPFRRAICSYDGAIISSDGSRQRFSRNNVKYEFRMQLTDDQSHMYDWEEVKRF